MECIPICAIDYAYHYNKIVRWKIGEQNDSVTPFLPFIPLLGFDLYFQ